MVGVKEREDCESFPVHMKDGTSSRWRPRMPKIFYKEPVARGRLNAVKVTQSCNGKGKKSSLATGSKNPRATAQTASVQGAERPAVLDEWASRMEGRYAKIAALNKNLKTFKVDRCRKAVQRRLTSLPGTYLETDGTRVHPFRSVQLQEILRHPGASPFPGPKAAVKAAHLGQASYSDCLFPAASIYLSGSAGQQHMWQSTAGRTTEAPCAAASVATQEELSPSRPSLDSTTPTPRGVQMQDRRSKQASIPRVQPAASDLSRVQMRDSPTPRLRSLLSTQSLLLHDKYFVMRRYRELLLRKEAQEARGAALPSRQAKSQTRAEGACESLLRLPAAEALTASISSLLLTTEPGAWTEVEEDEYQLYTFLFSKLIRRRSYIAVARWKKAKVIIGVMKRFSDLLASQSMQLESDNMTFTQIADQALTEDDTAKKRSYKRTGAEAQLLRLTMKTQVLMTHPPQSRTNDEITLILCELQCYPSFCTYPLEIQNKIASFGMYMPVGKRRVIVRQGHEPQNWYFVISGQATVTELVDEEPKRVMNTVKFVGPGDTFGEEAILSHTNQPYTVCARRDMELICLDKTHFYDVFYYTHYKQSDVPNHVAYLLKMPFMVAFPAEMLTKHPAMSYQKYARPNTVLIADSVSSDWICVVRSGHCDVFMYIPSTRASWRDLELALAHPTINIDGLPLPRTDVGKRLPRRWKTHTLFQRTSATDIEGGDMDQVPALHMTWEGVKNVQHGLHLLTSGRIMCPWPLDFFMANDRTAFPVCDRSNFPIEPDPNRPPFTPKRPEPSEYEKRLSRIRRSVFERRMKGQEDRGLAETETSSNFDFPSAAATPLISVDVDSGSCAAGLNVSANNRQSRQQPAAEPSQSGGPPAPASLPRVKVSGGEDDTNSNSWLEEAFYTAADSSQKREVWVWDDITVITLEDLLGGKLFLTDRLSYQSGITEEANGQSLRRFGHQRRTQPVRGGMLPLKGPGRSKTLAHRCQTPTTGKSDTSFGRCRLLRRLVRSPVSEVDRNWNRLLLRVSSADQSRATEFDALSLDLSSTESLEHVPDDAGAEPRGAAGSGSSCRSRGPDWGVADAGGSSHDASRLTPLGGRAKKTGTRRPPQDRVARPPRCTAGMWPPRPMPDRSSNASQFLSARSGGPGSKRVTILNTDLLAPDLYDAGPVPSLSVSTYDTGSREAISIGISLEKRKESDTGPAPSPPNDREGAAAAAAEEDSCLARRKKYVIPTECKPPRRRSRKRTLAPYECRSPPVYVKIETLGEGDTFGLDQLGDTSGIVSGSSGRVALISQGAEVVMLNKRFFTGLATDRTMVAVRENMRYYPTQESVRTRLRLKLGWELYSEKVKDELYQRLNDEGYHHTGTYFQPTPVKMEDAFAVLKRMNEED